MDPIRIYGIKNCDTMKKAFVWLDQNKVPYIFHDYKTLGITEKKIHQWLTHFEPNKLANTKGTTWKQLTEKEQESLQDANALATLLVDKTSIIKRPLVELPKGYLLGFIPEEWEKALLK